MSCVCAQRAQIFILKDLKIKSLKIQSPARARKQGEFANNHGVANISYTVGNRS